MKSNVVKFFFCVKGILIAYLKRRRIEAAFGCLFTEIEKPLL
jgi:hypothetical protein